ncbi:MAG: T9SS type A sorting domain-containing protein [Bacteroides sp.]|jgi:hypothetical protein|nr:T9SS type A sorting domain-containing protein [Bacteroides sp.]
MKKFFTLCFVFMLALGVQAQSVLFSQDFSGTFPPEGWTISAQAGNWSAVNTTNAGGTAPEVRLNWSPQFNGETRLTTQTIDVSASAATMMVLSFKQMVDNYSGNYQIGLAARTKNGAWSVLWSQTVSGSIPAQTKAIQITDGEMLGANDLQFSFFFSGNSYNINYWYIDDVQLIVPDDFDLGITKLSVPTHFMGATAVTGTVTGLGLEEITSFDLNWKVDDGPVETQSYTDLSLEYNESINFESTSMMDLESGTHTLTVTLSNINGETLDDNVINNEYSMLVHVAHQEVQRLPLFESFTSSTCGPCASFNGSFFNNFTQQNQGELALIKYQMSWPSPGDPYYTEEGGVRRAYYGVNAVPYLIIEGKQVSTSSTAVNTAFQNAKTLPAYMAIEGYHAVELDNIMVEATILPYADFPNITIHVVVIEGTTTGNAGSNGETSFKHVMMKMLPDASGTTANLNELEPYTISHDFDMSVTHVEQMEDLKVVIFVQNHSTKEIYQAGNTVMPTHPQVMVNLEEGETNVSLEPEIIISFDQPVHHTDGSEITAENISDILHLNETDANGATVEFTAIINEEKTEISLQPNDPLSEEQLYYVKVNPVSEYSPFMFLSEPVEITFTTLSTVDVDNPALKDFVVYPNPASEYLQVRFPVEGHTELRLLDMRGNLIVEKTGTSSQFRMDVSSLPVGVYFLEIRSNEGRMMKKISIVR